ncbi:nucleoside hydrolase [Bacillus sp. 2205SS5-2]|uniref:nucleoside hydrolase n=1 Tax=Bacillus sp. 2205SS5-2 TaxID=3109031 RepID=UPI003003BD72
MGRKILFFSDFGIDDMVAGLYAHYSEELDIIGFVADYGNVSREDAIRNTIFLSRLTGREDIPIVSGAYSPLTAIKPTYYPEVHGLEGLGPIIPQYEITNGQLLENFYKIPEIIAQYSEEGISIFNAGRLTSLSTCFILFPEAMKKVKEIYIMGGAFDVPGNVTPVAEANIYGDPYAANIILKLSKQKVYFVPLNVTQYAILTPQLINYLHERFVAKDDKVGMIIKPMVDYYFEFYKKRDPTIDGSPLHDLLALWAMSSEAEITFEEHPIAISLDEGRAFGQTMGDFRSTIEKIDWPIHYVAKSFHYGKFIKQVVAMFQNNV